MGCSNSVPKTASIFPLEDLAILNQPLKTALEEPKEKNSKISSLIIRSSEILKKYESIRRKLIDELDEIIFKTGAYIFKYPLPLHCFKLLMFKLAIRSKGNLEVYNITFLDDPPFVQMENVENCFEYKRILAYIISLSYLKTTLKELENDLPELFYLINEVDIFESNKKCINDGINLLVIMKKFNTLSLSGFRNEVFSLLVKKNNYDEQLKLIVENANLFGNGDNISQFFAGLKVLKNKYRDIFSNIYLENNEADAREKISQKIGKKSNPLALTSK